MFKLSGNALPRMSLLLATFSLAACGGGGGGSSSDDGNNLEPGTTTVDPGFFMTTITYASGEEPDRASTLLSPTGEYVTVISDADGTFGELTFRSDDTFSGAGTNVFFDGGWQSEDGSLEGNVVSPQELIATYTAPRGNSELTLERANEFSDLGVTLGDLEGIYLMSGGISTSVTINSNGEVTDGSDSTGCVISGTITIPNPAFNIFEVDLTLSNCGEIEGGATSAQRNGEYEGLGAYDPENSELLFSGTNGKVVALFIGVK